MLIAVSPAALNGFACGEGELLIKAHRIWIEHHHAVRKESDIEPCTALLLGQVRLVRQDALVGAHTPVLCLVAQVFEGAIGAAGAILVAFVVIGFAVEVLQGGMRHGHVISLIIDVVHSLPVHIQLLTPDVF